MRQHGQFRSTSTLVWTYVANTVLLAHRRGPQLDTHFDLFHSDVNAHPGLTGIIVLAHDSPPPAKQRAAIQLWFRQTKARGAVLTDSLFARGAVTALSWIGATIAAFPRSNLEAAVDFVQVPTEHHMQALRVLQELDSECA